MPVKLVTALVFLTAGRAMTLAFIARAGDGGPGDPPEAWLMPLLGDAAIGLAALALGAAILWRPGPTVWLATVAWSAVGAFDALAAHVVNTTAPWPDFFMLELFGPTMFVAAAALHLLIIGLLVRSDVLAHFGLERPGAVTQHRAV